MNGYDREDYEREEKMRSKIPLWQKVGLALLLTMVFYALYLFIFK